MQCSATFLLGKSVNVKVKSKTKCIGMQTWKTGNCSYHPPPTSNVNVMMCVGNPAVLQQAYKCDLRILFPFYFFLLYKTIYVYCIRVDMHVPTFADNCER
ncbi:unnamed protein product [Orchesella dallaii]|uniref:Uncharacterized protein n=1 Tax=Orchesella dallaii TaxID=48710 RepID=A0ABP1PXD5_9HEXA